MLRPPYLYPIDPDFQCIRDFVFFLIAVFLYERIRNLQRDLIYAIIAFSVAREIIYIFFPRDLLAAVLI